MARLLHPRMWVVRTRSDRGSTTLEMTVIFPVVLIIFWACLQAAFYFHARAAALAAASEGARVAAAENGSAGAATAAASALAERADGTLVDAHAQVSRSATTVTTTVTGTALSIIPGGSWPITQSVTLPVERVTR